MKFRWNKTRTDTFTAKNQLFKANPTWWETADGSPIDPSQIIVMQKSLDTNGNVYVVLEDHQTVDITPEVKGNKFYSFTVGAGKQCAPVKLMFYDPPDRPATKWPFTWDAKLEVVCTGSGDMTDPNYTNYTSLGWITYGFSVDAAGHPTLHNLVNAGQMFDCGSIIVIDYETQSVGGIKIWAYYIGCCDNRLNWVQTITTSAPSSGNPTNSPYNDHLPTYPPPYVLQPGAGLYDIDRNTIDYSPRSGYPSTCYP